MPIFNHLIKTKLYLGHHQTLRHHYSSTFVIGKKKRINIINLIQTYTNFKKIIPIINNLYANKNTILIINTIPLKKPYIENFNGLSLKIIEKWPDGFITNFKHHKRTNFKKNEKDNNLLLNFYPGLIININSNKRITEETSKYKIPLINITDTNYNPFSLQYPIPANNKSLISGFFFLYFLKKICLNIYINKLYKFKY